MRSEPAGESLVDGRKDRVLRDVVQDGVEGDVGLIEGGAVGNRSLVRGKGRVESLDILLPGGKRGVADQRGLQKMRAS